MHEGHFTQQIVEAVIAELKKYPGRQVESLTVKVGEVYHLMPDAVVMHYEVLTKGSALEGVVLNLIEEPLEVLCADCHHQGPVADHHLLLCSSCHSRAVKAVAGDKVAIERIIFKSGLNHDKGLAS